MNAYMYILLFFLFYVLFFKKLSKFARQGSPMNSQKFYFFHCNAPNSVNIHEVLFYKKLAIKKIKLNTLILDSEIT